jgi:phosphatidylserine decarboxylase
MKKETLMIRFLYGTTPGRAILRLLVRPTVSRKVGKFLDSRFSRCLVPLFIKKHHIDMKDYEDRLYVSFNDFFTRKRCVERIDITPKHLISPCDGYLSVYPVEENLTYRIKHVEYSLERLVNSRDLAEQFAGGTCLIFRLTPQDYHRYCYVCDGIRTESGAIGGCLHCVRPAAYTSVPVFVENSREYIVLSTPAFGTVVQMEVGALLVGKIHNLRSNSRIFQGQEKGYFEFGGSTILVLVKKDRLELSEDVAKQTGNGKEMKICLGETVGVTRNVPTGNSLGNYLYGEEFPGWC